MARIAAEQWHGLQPSKGTDYKSAPAEPEVDLCELGEAKSAPAVIEVNLCELGEAKSAPVEINKSPLGDLGVTTS
jgi:hypothetical protein